MWNWILIFLPLSLMISVSLKRIRVERNNFLKFWHFFLFKLGCTRQKQSSLNWKGERKNGIRSNFHSHISSQQWTHYIFHLFTFLFKLFILLLIFISKRERDQREHLTKNCANILRKPCIKFSTWFIFVWWTTFSVYSNSIVNCHIQTNTCTHCAFLCKRNERVIKINCSCSIGKTNNNKLLFLLLMLLLLCRSFHLTKHTLF